MRKNFLRQHGEAECEKGHFGLNALGLSAVDRDVPCLLCPVFIVEADDQVSALPGQVLRANGPSVQGVADLHPHREPVPALSLIADFFSVILPDQAAVSFLTEFLVPLGVFDVGEPRPVADASVCPAASQQRFHRHIADRTVRTGLDIDRLFLVPVSFPQLPGPEGGFGRRRFRRCRGGWAWGRRHLRRLPRREFQRAAAHQDRTAKKNSQNSLPSFFHSVRLPSM